MLTVFLSFQNYIYNIIYTHIKWDMELRKRPKPDYRLLDRGESVSQNSCFVANNKLSWSTSKLWQLEVIDERVNESGNEEVLVHYSGWANTWDEWRPKTDIIDKPAEHECSDAHTQFLCQVKIQVKESLNLSRLQNPEVTLQLPVQQETFDKFVEGLEAEVSATRGVRKILRAPLSAWSRVLGTDSWWWRVGNEAGDFAYVDPSTLQLWLTERQPLIEYTRDLKRKLVHRGYLCVIRFVKQTGSHGDMDILDKY